MALGTQGAAERAAAASRTTWVMVAKVGWEFGWNALHDLMDRAIDEEEIEAIRRTLEDTPGVIGVHDLRTRRMGDIFVVDVHIEVDATLSVEAGHAIAVEARSRVMRLHRVLSLLAHVDPWRPEAPDGTCSASCDARKLNEFS